MVKKYKCSDGTIEISTPFKSMKDLADEALRIANEDNPEMNVLVRADDLASVMQSMRHRGELMGVAECGLFAVGFAALATMIGIFVIGRKSEKIEGLTN